MSDEFPTEFTQFLQTDEAGNIIGWPISLETYCQRNHNHGFSAKPDFAELALKAKLFPVELITPPIVDQGCYNIASDFPELINGKYKQRFRIVQRSFAEASGFQRSKRNSMLQESDWTQLMDSPLTAEKKVIWATYRQQLRDITQQTDFPYTISWPMLPE